jgi:YVTN family beta-propeller protein
MAMGKLYVTNWAGRHPLENDKDVAGIPWGLAKVNNKAGGSTREGSVTIIDPNDGRIIKELIVGLHPNEIITGTRGRFVYVTNSNSDNVSVINTLINEVVETISVRLQPEINPFFGDSPDGLCLSADEKTLYVANGMDNALAVVALGKKSARKSRLKTSSVTGFIPTGAYPSAICLAPSGMLYVANLEADGVRLGLSNPNGSNLIYNSHHMLPLFQLSRYLQLNLKAYTDTVIVQMIFQGNAGKGSPGKNMNPKPVPDRIGELSVFKHVLYIIKENRTYDQVLGDMPEGRGDSARVHSGKNNTEHT